MKAKSLEIAQDIPYNRTVLKRICGNFWVPCKKDPMANPVLVIKDRKCNFCKKKENNKLKYGPLYELNRIVAHYYCVLCSTRMKQNGNDNEGIMGFLLRDINLELRRSKKISCAYCPEKNATVECAHQGCKTIFHFPCGLQRGALSRFRNDFVTFCFRHRPKQKVPKKILEEALNTELICAICYEEVEASDRKDNLWAPCCMRTWYHRNCVQKLAHSSGYFFRCATCNDAGKFKAHMEDNGIFVPQQDASWELVPNAYEELLVRHNRCDADECKCPEGREENVEDTRWEIILCRFCGSQGMHVGCGNLKFSDPEWECPTCNSIMKTDSKSAKVDEKEKENEREDEEEEQDDNDDDHQDDATVEKSPVKSDEQPAAAPRKRKLPVQRRSLNKRKKNRGDGERSADNDPQPSVARATKSSDEFYIRLPDFLFAEKKQNDKPHTVTKPDEESDEDVDVISVDTAWLMVEEVLSRVKPGPLSYKLRFLRKKVFSYHFDPFDIREEIETIDLTSDTEDNSSVLKSDKKYDTDSDVEFIGEVKDSSNKEKSRQESHKMEPDLELDEVSQPPNVAEGAVAPDVPELSDTESLEDQRLFEGDRASEGSEAADEPMVSDVSQGSEVLEVYGRVPEGPEAVQYVEFPEFPEVRPSTSQERTEFESTMETTHEEMVPSDDDQNGPGSEIECFYGKQSYGHVEYVVEEQSSEEVSDVYEDILQEAGQRQVGRKHPASGIQYRNEVKRARTTATTSDDRAVDANTQYQVPVQNLPASAPLLSQPSISDPSSNPVFSMEQTFDDNQSVIKTINLTGLSIMDPSGLGTMLVPNNSYVLINYGDNRGQTLLNASMTSTTSTTFICEPSTSGMAASVPSTSGIAASLPSTSAMAASLPSTSEMGTCLPSISGLAASLPSNFGMPLPLASASGMAASLPSISGRDAESGRSTPLPSFQFLSNLQPNMSPLPSSNSSGSASLNNSQSALPLMENTSSCEGCNVNDLQKPAP